MKFRSDFITNSSSTAFFFIFKGNKKEELFDLIRKYKEKFNLQCDFSYGSSEDCRSCDYHFVIDSLDEIIGKEINFETICNIKPIDHFIEEEYNQVEWWEKELEKDKRACNPSMIEICKNGIKSHKHKIKLLKDAESKGLTSCLKVSFGDNHGHIFGERASVLDYNSKDVEIKENDFHIITENQH